MIWFASDLHFNAQRTIDISKRPFDSLEQLNKTLINNWNKVVSKNDTVYILGDFGDFYYAQFLNGYKIFILGNYERGHYSIEYLSQFFDYVCPDRVMNISLDYNNKVYNLSLTHEPNNLNKDKPLSENYIGLFGHTHKLCLIKKYGIGVSIDLHNYAPISFEDVLFYHNAALNYYDDNVFC